MFEALFSNPFRPGAGQMPPYLAGRDSERQEFAKLLAQDTILDNLILTGLRGVGKTVLLESLKPIAVSANWVWVGNDLSESTSVSEENLALRLTTDVAVYTSSISISEEIRKPIGLLLETTKVSHALNFDALRAVLDHTPGLASDKLKVLLELVWETIRPLGKRGLIFAYDEAQNLGDNPLNDEYPLSLLLDVFQSIQRKGIPFMLVLVGLPTLFPKLVETRTYTERMFHVVHLGRLDEESSREAIIKPIEDANCPVKFHSSSVKTIYDITLGYPYFIQFVCREVYDVWTLKAQQGIELPSVPTGEIMRKLDGDFFAGRWARATDRQRDLLAVIAGLDNSSSEFTVQDIVEGSKNLSTIRTFGNSHVSQLLVNLNDAGLVYKNRWGKYSLAVPLLDQFILRQTASN